MEENNVRLPTTVENVKIPDIDEKNSNASETSAIDDDDYDRCSKNDGASLDGRHCDDIDADEHIIGHRPECSAANFTLQLTDVACPLQGPSPAINSTHTPPATLVVQVTKKNFLTYYLQQIFNHCKVIIKLISN